MQNTDCLLHNIQCTYSFTNSMNKLNYACFVPTVNNKFHSELKACCSTSEYSKKNVLRAYMYSNNNEVWYVLFITLTEFSNLSPNIHSSVQYHSQPNFINAHTRLAACNTLPKYMIRFSIYKFTFICYVTLELNCFRAPNINCRTPYFYF